MAAKMKRNVDIRYITTFQIAMSFQIGKYLLENIANFIAMGGSFVLQQHVRYIQVSIYRNSAQKSKLNSFSFLPPTKLCSCKSFTHRTKNVFLCWLGSLPLLFAFVWSTAAFTMPWTKPIYDINAIFRRLISSTFVAFK